MESFGSFSKTKKTDLPNSPGTTKIPTGHIRLYHQTTPENIESIRKNGLRLSNAKGIEGPKSVYADETGFYGDVTKIPTVEFHVPKDKWNKPFVSGDVSPENIIAIHEPWHEMARHMESEEETKKSVLGGEHDDILSMPSFKNTPVRRAIEYIKDKYKNSVQESTRLSLSSPSFSENIENFMKEYHSSTEPHPFSPRKRVFGNAMSEIYPLKRNGEEHVHITDILSTKPRSGAGGKLIRHLTNLADKHGVTLKGYADPYLSDKKYITQKPRLEKFYKDRGFKINRDGEDSEITYRPRGI